MLRIKLHPFNYLLLPIITIISISLSKNINELLFIDAIAILILLTAHRNITLKPVFIFSLFMIPSLLSFALSSVLFSEIDQKYFILRIFSLAIISFIYAIHTPYEDLMTNLMQRKLIPINIGFAIIAIGNAFKYLKQEFIMIQLTYQMRFGKRTYSPKIFIPLLIAAARYSHHLSISMYARGINKNRTFLQEKIPFRVANSIFLLLLIMLYMLILGVFNISFF